MAGSSYNYDKSNPFFSSEDVDDATFLRGARRAYDSSTVEERHQQLLEEKRKIEERTVQSSYRSLSLLHDSEQIGIATAEELTRQREQLTNTEQKLDEINSTLRVSQRHIQGIKSVFGSIRNYFSGSKNDGSKLGTSTTDRGEPQTENSSAKTQLTQILESRNENVQHASSVHPTERFRSDVVPNSQQVDDVLDRNLEDIGVSLSRLKHLGLDLNKDIVEQNSMIDRINNKTEDVDFKIQGQTKDMNRILKK